MRKHEHAAMIKAKADNMDLVVFIKMGNSEWTETSEIPTCEGFKYFLCLPQHNENGQCLHWLNGGEIQDYYENEWSRVGEFNGGEWSIHTLMMDENASYRIKPRKENRWIVAKPSSLASMMYFESEEQAKSTVKFSTGEFKGGQVIEIEVEV